MKIYVPLLLMLCLTGCGNRTSIAESDAVTVYKIETKSDQKAGFFAAEEAMGDAWNSWKDVNQVRQPETGTLLVKGLYSYSELITRMDVRVTVKVKAIDNAIVVTYTIGQVELVDGKPNGWSSYPSEKAIGDLRRQFDVSTEKIAETAGGTIVSRTPAAVAGKPEPATSGNAPRRGK
jgi:hypothetical protein